MNFTWLKVSFNQNIKKVASSQILSKMVFTVSKILFIEMSLIFSFKRML